ncbi:MAG: DUF4126 domain-containing protein [Acidobacteriota bacterium]
MGDPVLAAVTALAAGIVLAAAAGLRAFLPLAGLAWAARLGFVSLNQGFSWLGADTAVAALTVAVLFELLGDKIPAVDHALDAVGVLVKPLAGMVVIAASVASLPPFWAAVLGIVAGAPLAGGIHLVKAKGRVLANLATLGFAAPLISLVEDIAGAILVVTALLVPFLALVLAVLLFVVFRRGRRAAPASVPTPDPPRSTRS